ncbi:MAG: hypothetical protein Q8P60_15775 [Pseudorhodobacter sp.]|nr:hypothetical protein [Pseudorhodobacter sp.]
MARIGVKAVLFGLWLGAVLPLSLAAAGWDELDLGEATLSITQDWQLTDQRRDVEAVYAGPTGESLRVFWWFPDEPLLGYDGEISHETRSFRAGLALVVRSQIAGRSVVQVAFERESADKERLLFLIESETATPEALEAALEPILQRLRFEGDPEPVTVVPTLPDAGGWHHDMAGDFSVRLPGGWNAYGADIPGVRRLSILAPGGDAIVLAAVADSTEVMDAYETRFYQDQVIPRQIEAESHDPVAGIEGHAINVSARIYGMGGISMPYGRGLAWVFRGLAGDRAVMLAFVHANDAPEDQRRMLRAIAESFVLGPPPDGTPANEQPPTIVFPQTDLAPTTQAPVNEPAAVAEQAMGTAPPSVSIDAVLAALGPVYGGDCAPVDHAVLPATAALTALSLAPEAAALCPVQGVAILTVRLPQDPRKGQAGPLGMAYLRAHLAQGRRPLVLVDLAHGILVTVKAAGGVGITVEIASLADVAVGAADAASPTAVESALPLKTQIFSGVESPDWQPHAVSGGKFDDWAGFGAGGFTVDVPMAPDYRTTGLKSANPLVTLPSAGDRQSVRLRFDFDTETTNNAVFALVPAEKLGKFDWDGHEIWVAIEQKRDAGPQLVLAVQRKVQGRYDLINRGDLEGLTLELRPDGMVLLSNASDRVLVEGRMEARPLSNDLHLQVSATAPGNNVPARLDLRRIVMERSDIDPANDPALLLAEVSQTATLFDGRTLGPYFAVHAAPRGVDLTGKLTIAKALRVASPKGDGLNGLGIYAPQPVVWLDSFGKGASARLRFEFDPAQTSGFRLSLASPYTYSDADPGFPRFVLDWHRVSDGSIRASRWIDRDLARLDATPDTIPEVVELLLTPDGVQVLAEGFPSDILPWDGLREGQGFRLYAVAKAETKADPVSMVLNRILLTRTPGTDRQSDPVPMPGVEPLPVVRHFPNPQTQWEPYGLAGLNFESSGRFDDSGTLIVDVAAKYEGGRAGILSGAPVAVLDERITKTPYRLTLRFDPQLTDGVEVMLSNQKVADMWKGSDAALSLIRQSGGREAGNYVLTLTKDYYAYWIRTISGDDMARWDGTMQLDLAPDTLTVSLPGVVTLRGTGFNGIAKGAAFHMIVQSRSDTKYGPARMALRQAEGQWIMPEGMTLLRRMELIDPTEFDAEAYLDALADDLQEDIQ